MGETDQLCTHTALVQSSAGVTGMFVAASFLRLHAFKMFFMRGASCRFASAFCREGTGWYVRNAVRISGRTTNISGASHQQRNQEIRRNGQVIVVLTRPTLAKSDILAKSVAKSGVSTILSRSALEHRGEFINACT